jgi:hypothetical protein
MNLAERVIRRVDYYVSDRRRTPESSGDLASNLAEDRRLLPVVVGEGPPHPLLDSDGDVHALDFAVAAEMGRMIGLSDRLRIHGRTEQRMVARVMEQLLPAGRIAHALGDDQLEIGILRAKSSRGLGKEGFVRVSDVVAARTLAHRLATEDEFRGGAAAFLYGFVALAGSPVGGEPDESPEELVPKVPPVDLAVALAGDSEQLPVVSEAAEAALADLRPGVNRSHIDREDAASTEKDGSIASLPAAPSVFISHASEDKERFVVEFARRLRSDGVNAWLDMWEMGPGDSLVRRIVDEGIAKADVFLVVLSERSIDKPWVREELDLGLVQRITGECRVIPVVLDGVAVPKALHATVWQSVSDPSAYDVEYGRILGAIFGVSDRPPLGNPPAFVAAALLPGLNRSDSALLISLANVATDNGDRLLMGDQLRESLERSGLDKGSVLESVHALYAAGLTEEPGYGPFGLSSVKLSWAGLVSVLEATRPGLLKHRLSIIGRLVNRPQPSVDLGELAGEEGISQFVAEVLLKPLALRGLLTLGGFIGGTVYVRDISPLLRRELAAD